MNKFKIRIAFWNRMAYKTRQRLMHGYKKPYVSIEEGQRWRGLESFCQFREKLAEHEYITTRRFENG